MKKTVVIQFLLAAATSHITGDDMFDNPDDIRFGTNVIPYDGVLGGNYGSGRTNGASSSFQFIHTVYTAIMILNMLSFFIINNLQNR